MAVLQVYWSLYTRSPRLLFATLGWAGLLAVSEVLYFGTLETLSQFQRAFGTRQGDLAYSLIVSLATYVLLISACKGAIKWLDNAIIWLVRRQLTDQMHEAYVGCLPPLSGCDQRITYDIPQVAILVQTLAGRLLIAPPTICAYTWRIIRAGFPATTIAALYLHFGVGAVASLWLTRSLASLFKQVDEAEGDFRSNHALIARHAESIKLESLEQHALQTLGRSFASVASLRWTEGSRKAGLELAVEFFSYSSSLLVYMLVTYDIFFGEMLSTTPSQMAQRVSVNVGLMLYLIMQLNKFVGCASVFGDLGGAAGRLNELLDALDACKAASKGVPASEHFELVDAVIECEGRVLVRNLSVTFDRNTLITGPSGVGKSTLIRILAGRWPLRRGAVSGPASRVVLVPQNPQMFASSLAVFFEQETLDASLKRILLLCNLGRLVCDVSFADQFTPNAWAQMLSPGELQRLYFARLLHLRPPFAILDESTGAVEAELEQRLYGELVQHTRFISVAHHVTAIAPYCQQHLELFPTGDATLKPIEHTGEPSVC